jgi:NNP family nitrate/nitrite transporter-like MFS transporter
MQDGLFYLGLCVVIASLFVFFVRFSPKTIEEEKRAFQEAQAQKTAAVGS